jgi:lipopolysaccharide export system permease protein
LKRIDRLVLLELYPPFLFGIGLFSALILAGTYLNKIAELVVSGVPAAQIAQLMVLLIPPVLVKTFSMATLLAALLAFGRLSSDSEIVALRAGGASIYRIVRPVMLFSVVVATVTFIFDERVVPAAALEARDLLIELANSGQVNSGEPFVAPIMSNGHMDGLICARTSNFITLHDVTVTAYGREGNPTYVLLAKEMDYKGGTSWHIRGRTTLMPAAGGWSLDTNEAWPDEVPKLTSTPLDLATQSNNDNDEYSMAQIKAQIDRARREKNIDQKRIANLEYGYWTKLGVPLAAVVFGSLGAVLGIRNHRTGTATGFALAVAIIFAYVTLANFMNVWALAGVLPAWGAAFLPLALGSVCTAIIIWRRNV